MRGANNVVPCAALIRRDAFAWALSRSHVGPAGSPRYRAPDDSFAMTLRGGFRRNRGRPHRRLVPARRRARTYHDLRSRKCVDFGRNQDHNP